MSDDSELINLIRKIYNYHKGRYGYRRIHAELIKSHGLQINHKTVLRLMRKMGLKSKIRRKKQYFGISESYKSPNIMNRDFVAEKPLNKLSTDVTYLKVNGSKYYLSVIFDLFNNEVRGYEVSQHNDINLVLNSLSNSNLILTNAAILHSDQGHQYTSHAYTNKLLNLGLTKSMSRRGNCLDNACIESFFGHLKSESIYLNMPKSYDELKITIKDYIDYYNNDRIQLRLNKMTPIEYRRHYEKTVFL